MDGLFSFNSRGPCGPTLDVARRMTNLACRFRARKARGYMRSRCLSPSWQRRVPVRSDCGWGPSQNNSDRGLSHEGSALGGRVLWRVSLESRGLAPTWYVARIDLPHAPHGATATGWFRVAMSVDCSSESASRHARPARIGLSFPSAGEKRPVRHSAIASSAQPPQQRSPPLRSSRPYQGPGGGAGARRLGGPMIVGYSKPEAAPDRGTVSSHIDFGPCASQWRPQ